MKRILIFLNVSSYKTPFFGVSLYGWSPILGGTVLLFSETTAPPIPPSTVLIQVLIRASSDSSAILKASFTNLFKVASFPLLTSGSDVLDQTFSAEL